MSTPEEILNDCISCRLQDIPESLYHEIINAMNDYAKFYHDSEVKKLNIPAVVGRSEQLKALLEKLRDENMCSVVGDELIEEVLKGF